MSAHGANPIFVNEKIKIGPPEHLLTPDSTTPDNISLLPHSQPPPSKWTSFVYGP